MLINASHVVYATKGNNGKRIVTPVKDGCDVTLDVVLIPGCHRTRPSHRKQGWLIPPALSVQAALCRLYSEIVDAVRMYVYVHLL